MEVIDQLNRKLLLSKSPQRIISLVPSQTELLVDLGLEDKIIGITKFCIHPKHLKKKKAIIGGTKHVNYDKIIKLQPDFIICNKEENTEEILRELEQISLCYVSDIITIDDNFQFINDVGKIFNIKPKTDELVNIIKSKLVDFKLYIDNKFNRKIAYFIWREPWMVAGNKTFINELLELNRFENIFARFNRYPEIDINGLKDLKLDLIFLSSEPYPFKEKHIEELSKYTNAKIILVNGEYFSWYGSRLIRALDYFKTLH